jgi:adenosylcobinamide-GDP ribazoletransferase
MKKFLLTLQFLTRLPISIKTQVNTEDFIGGILYFPFIGLIIGGLNLLAYNLLSLFLGKTITIIAVMMVNILVTGALHLDGLADTCDGVFSNRPKDKMLEIMRDSRIGTNGTIAIFFDLALRMVLLMQIDKSHMAATLLLTPTISRAAMVLLIASSPPAREGKGLGNLFLGKAGRWSTVIALASALVIAGAMLKFDAVAMIAVNVTIIILYRWRMIAKIGGMTGDTLGAGNELSEVVALLSFVLLWGGKL